MKSATLYENRPKTTTAATGSKLKREYHMELDKNGHKYLVEEEPSDWYGKIQSHKEECDIAGIVEKAIRGDDSALNKVKGMYMDMTKLPKNLAEAQNTIAKFKEGFAGLPTDINRQFDNSPDVYVANLGTQRWENIMGITDMKKEMEHNEALKKEREKMLEDAIKNLGGKKDE